MAGSTLASPSAEVAGGAAPARPFSPWRDAWRRFRRHRLAFASAVILLRDDRSRSLFGPFVWQVRDQRHRLHGAPAGAVAGRIRSAPTTSGRTCSRACSTAGASRSRSASSAMVVAIVVGTIIGAIAGMSRGWVGPALMWLTDLFLSLPQLPLLLLVIYLFRDCPEGRVRPRGRRLHHDRRRHRRPALDAGGAARARAIPLAAREGVRRGGARARRQQGCARSCATSCRTRSGR